MSDAIPQRLMDEAEHCYLVCEQMDSQGIIQTIAAALLAAERRGVVEDLGQVKGDEQ